MRLTFSSRSSSSSSTMSFQSMSCCERPPRVLGLRSCAQLLIMSSNRRRCVWLHSLAGRSAGGLL